MAHHPQDPYWKGQRSLPVGDASPTRSMMRTFLRPWRQQAWIVLGRVSANNGGLNDILRQGEVEGTHLFPDELALHHVLVSMALPTDRYGRTSLACALAQLGTHSTLFTLEGRPVDGNDR